MWLWVALAGAVLQILALFGPDFYFAQGERKDAWFGIPHASDLILLSAVVAIGAVVLMASGRNPLQGRSMGLVVGVVGLLATLQLVYRMIVPPFGGAIPANSHIIGAGCLYYCSPSEAAPADLLLGIWLAFLGCLAVTVGGFVYAYSRAARQAPARPWVAPAQGGMSPWLGLAALGAVGQFVFGYTFFTFFTTPGDNGGELNWSGWLPTPHTSSLVLLISLLVVGLVWTASRGRAPLGPAALGVAVAVLGLVSTYRIFYRITSSPFGPGGSEIGVAAYLSLTAAILIVVAGLVHAVLQRGTSGAAAPSRVT
ncbi:MAG: hypothetical protein H0U55_17920 [Rubrobacteraceae bacterium]|nr:hypothetical protein [Rubrobacteraceae bacterium]